MDDFLKFRKMITPVIIQVLFWVGVAGTVIAALVVMAMSFGSYGGGAAQFLGGLVMLGSWAGCGKDLLRTADPVLPHE